MIEFLAGAAVYAVVRSLFEERRDDPSAPKGFIKYGDRYVRIPERTEFNPQVYEDVKEPISIEELNAAITRARGTVRPPP